MVDSSQGLAASYRYDPFGNTISSSGPTAATNVYRFSSKENHVNSGMYYYEYRFYDPNLQRWISGDQVEELGFKRILGFTFSGAHRDQVPYFHAKLGTWVTRDPIDYKDGLNLYAYTRNQPISLLDPNGTWCLELAFCFLIHAHAVHEPPTSCCSPRYRLVCDYHCYPIIVYGTTCDTDYPYGFEPPSQVFCGDPEPDARNCSQALFRLTIIF